MTWSWLSSLTPRSRRVGPQGASTRAGSFRSAPFTRGSCWAVGGVSRLEQRRVSAQFAWLHTAARRTRHIPRVSAVKPVRFPGGRPLHRRRKATRRRRARHAPRAETWTCEERHRGYDRQSVHRDVARVQGEAGPLNLCTLALSGLHVRCAAVVLCVPTREEVKGTGRSISARHFEVCRSEGHLVTQSGGGILVSSPACSPTSSSRRSSAFDKLRNTISTYAGTATSLSARYPRQSGGRYACCSLDPTWTLALPSFVTSTVWPRLCSMFVVFRRVRSVGSPPGFKVTFVTIVRALRWSSVDLHRPFS